jgi:hypothetical protein
MTFGIGVLSIPTSFYTLGLIAGIVFVLFWGILNTCESGLPENTMIRVDVLNSPCDT